jgi:hypothetical protein
MAYPSMPLSRHSRRRRRFGIVALIAVLVGLVVAAVWVRSEARDVSAYLDLASRVADDEREAAAALHDLLDGLGGLERPEALDRMTRVQSAATGVTGSLEEAEVPASLGVVHGYLTVAASTWEEGLDTLEEAMLTILDQPEDPRGESMLAAAIALLRVGDRAYEGFRDALADLEEGTVTREYPEVAFVEVDTPNLYNPAMVATRLRAFAALSERHDIAVTGTVEPLPVGERNEIPVVPATEEFVVNAVVSNVGNLPESNLSIRLELTRVGSGQPPMESTRSVATLAPGTANTLQFTGLPIEPGVIYEVVVSTRVADDANPGNDRWSFVFLQNEES